MLQTRAGVDLAQAGLVDAEGFFLFPSGRNLGSRRRLLFGENTPKPRELRRSSSEAYVFLFCNFWNFPGASGLPTAWPLACRHRSARRSVLSFSTGPRHCPQVAARQVGPNRFRGRSKTAGKLSRDQTLSRACEESIVRISGQSMGSAVTGVSSRCELFRKPGCCNYARDEEFEMFGWVPFTRAVASYASATASEEVAG